MSESHGKHDDKGVQPRVANRGLHQLPPSVPFDGKSTMSTDFPSWNGARPSTSARPARAALATGAEDRYDTFVAHPPIAIYMLICYVLYLV
jgi:hypothetical protein